MKNFTKKYLLAISLLFSNQLLMTMENLIKTKPSAYKNAMYKELEPNKLITKDDAIKIFEKQYGKNMPALTKLVNYCSEIRIVKEIIPFCKTGSEIRLNKNEFYFFKNKDGKPCKDDDLIARIVHYIDHDGTFITLSNGAMQLELCSHHENDKFYNKQIEIKQSIPLFYYFNTMQIDISPDCKDLSGFFAGKVITEKIKVNNKEQEIICGYSNSGEEEIKYSAEVKKFIHNFIQKNIIGSTHSGSGHLHIDDFEKVAEMINALNQKISPSDFLEKYKKLMEKKQKSCIIF